MLNSDECIKKKKKQTDKLGHNYRVPECDLCLSDLINHVFYYKISHNSSSHICVRGSYENGSKQKEDALFKNDLISCSFRNHTRTRPRVNQHTSACDRRFDVFQVHINHCLVNVQKKQLYFSND